MRKYRPFISLFLGCVVLFAAGAVAAHGFNIRDSSESAIPDYIDDSGQLILDKVPAFVPVSDRTGSEVVGYAPREEVYREEFSPELLENVKPGELPDELDAPVPVYTSPDGGELIGHLFTEVGFVDLEEQRSPDFSLDDLRFQVDLTDIEE